MDDKQKEIERLNRRNKLLSKRIKKLQEENQNLAKELDTVEQLAEIKQTPTKRVTGAQHCPKCGGHIDKVNAYKGKQVHICSNFPECTYRGIF